MDGGVSSAAIEILLQNLINSFKEEFSLIRGLDKDVQQLHNTLSITQGYLNDVEKKSITQDAVSIWLRELEVVAFHADNVLDELSYHLLHKKIKTPKSKVSSCFSPLNSIIRPRNMALKIKQIIEDFESMNKRATELNLQSLLVNAPSAILNASFETNSFSLDLIFIGRDDDVLELVEKLTHIPQEEILSIVAIVGMSGMGKTTLTRKLFGHENVKGQFGLHIWVHVSQSFDPIILFNKILSALTFGTSPDGVESVESVLGKLQEALKAKTYLLVLDDVWNEDLPKWQHFIDSILGVTSSNGNVIIMTTMNDKVASLVKPLHIYHLNGLLDENCWSIIKAKAFENGDIPLEGFEMIGRDIAKRCQCSPLAANAVGGMLHRKSEEMWGAINEYCVSDGEGGENVSKILKLSFDHLPSPFLKKCFVYCLIFPKGHRIVKQEVIEQWMAEGFLEGDQRNEMEYVGNIFFNVLLHNSLLGDAVTDFYGDVESCVMHDLVNDMASSVLSSPNSAGGITRLRYMMRKQESSPIPKEVAKHLRTLFCEGEISDDLFSELECLHVLTLESYSVKELPDSIRKLIHLRNLNISHTRVEKLPKWIGELHYLQTLRAENEHLRLPSTLKYLTNLRHLYIYDSVELPAQIGRLTCLQTLTHFRVGDKKGYRIEELGSLKNLKGELTIRSLEKVHGKEEALKANVFQNPNFIDLHFEWGSERSEGDEINDESVLEGLQPHQNLKMLAIEGFKGKRFPFWSEKMVVQDGPQSSNWVPLNNLIQIVLGRCEECEEIPRLEHLPNLNYASLIALKKVRYINSALSKLKSLFIEDLEGLEHLSERLFHNNQNLSELWISACPKLRELPGCTPSALWRG